MKIKIDRTGDDVHISMKREPMAPERFTTVCGLVRGAIAGGVLLGIVHMVGVWGLVWGMGALVVGGLFNLMKGL